MTVPLPVAEVLARIHAHADRYRWDPVSPARSAGGLPFIYEQRGERTVVRRRTWLPDFYSPELTIELQSVRSDSARLRGTIQVPRVSRIVAAILLMLFVALAIVALVGPGTVDRAGTLVVLALSSGILVVLPLGVRWFRKDEERLVQFLHVCLPEVRNWRG